MAAVRSLLSLREKALCFRLARGISVGSVDGFLTTLRPRELVPEFHRYLRRHSLRASFEPLHREYVSQGPVPSPPCLQGCRILLGGAGAAPPPCGHLQQALPFCAQPLHPIPAP